MTDEVLSSSNHYCVTREDIRCAASLSLCFLPFMFPLLSQREKEAKSAVGGIAQNRVPGGDFAVGERFKRCWIENSACPVHAPLWTPPRSPVSQGETLTYPHGPRGGAIGHRHGGVPRLLRGYVVLLFVALPAPVSPDAGTVSLGLVGCVGRCSHRLLPWQSFCRSLVKWEEMWYTVGEYSGWRVKYAEGYLFDCGWK